MRGLRRARLRPGRAGRRRGKEDVLADPGGDARCGLPDRVAPQMGVARRGLDPRVAEQAGDRGQAFAERQRAAGEGVAQIM